MTTAQKLQLAITATNTAGAARTALYDYASQNSMVGKPYPHDALKAADVAVNAAYEVQLQLESDLSNEQDNPILDALMAA